jgi:hypothetical protein
MQNKPNLREAKMNVSAVKTKRYENIRLGGRRENKPNQSQCQRQKNAQTWLFRTFLSNLKKNSTGVAEFVIMTENFVF